MASSDILPKSVFWPGQKVRFTSDPKNSPVTIKTVSPFIEMVEIEETGGWCWMDGIAPILDEPDALQDSLDFLKL